MNRKEITKFLSTLLIQSKFSGRGKYYASEVTLDYGLGKGKEKRVDFIQFVPKNQTSISGLEKGIFICYEIKSCPEDFKSGCGLNFVGEKNYIVTTMQTYKDILHDIDQLGIHVGILVAIPTDKALLDEFEQPTPITNNIENWSLAIARQCFEGDRKRSLTELLFCMLRSGQ